MRDWEKGDRNCQERMGKMMKERTDNEEKREKFWKRKGEPNSGKVKVG